jgi:hypothetical protein
MLMDLNFHPTLAVFQLYRGVQLIRSGILTYQYFSYIQIILGRTTNIMDLNFHCHYLSLYVVKYKTKDQLLTVYLFI